MRVSIKPIVWPSVLLVAIFLIPSIKASASFHQDIEVSRVGSTLQAGFCSRPEIGCDIVGLELLGLPPNTLPSDFETGKNIYVTAFTHFVFSGQHATDNPGFQSVAGGLASNEVVHYKALGVMKFWNPATGSWNVAPENVKIRLAGGLVQKTVADQSCGLIFCPPKTTFENSFTTFSGKGVSGAESLIVGSATANGSLHTHLDWFLETTPGTANGGPEGAYLVEMSLFSNQRPTPSNSFFILFNNRLPDVQFQSAVSQRVLDSGSEPPPIPEPEISAWKKSELPVSTLAGAEPIGLATIGDNSYLFTENVSLGLASLDSGSISFNGQNARAIVNSKLYVFDTGSGPTRVFEIDQGNLVEKAPLMRMPTARFAAATLVTENDEIFVFGGKQTRPNGTSRLINRLESFNPLADTWNRHRNIPGISQREGAALAAASIGNKPYAFLLGGGVLQRNRLFGSVAGYDFMLNRWQTKGMTPMPTPRAFLSNIQAPVLNGKIYLIGGKSLNGAGDLIKSNKVEIYDPVSNTWQIGPDLPQEIREPLPFTDGNKLFVLDGLNNADNGKMTVWELDDAWIGSLEVGETCDLDGDGRFTNRDVNLFARACRTETAYWNCDLIGNGASIAKNTREYRRQWREHMNRACP